MLHRKHPDALKWVNVKQLWAAAQPDQGSFVLRPGTLSFLSPASGWTWFYFSYKCIFRWLPRDSPGWCSGVSPGACQGMSLHSLSWGCWSLLSKMNELAATVVQTCLLSGAYLDLPLGSCTLGSNYLHFWDQVRPCRAMQCGGRSVGSWVTRPPVLALTPAGCS